jgi:hypothetical protein
MERYFGGDPDSAKSRFENRVDLQDLHILTSTLISPPPECFSDCAALATFPGGTTSRDVESYR